MATISVSSGSYIRPVKLGGEIQFFEEDATQSFVKGDPLIFATTTDLEHRVKIAGADPGAIIGFAAEDATGTAGNKVGVYLADDDARFVVHVADSQTLDNNMLTAAGYGIVADGTNTIWRLDTSETTAKIFKVRQLIDAHGDVNGRVIASVLAAERAAEL